MGKRKDARWVRTTAEMEEILEDSKLTGAGDGSWDPLWDRLYRDKPEEEQPKDFYLTNWIATDETFILVFSNGHMELIGHPEGGDYADEGDYWYVGSLGWA